MYTYCPQCAPGIFNLDQNFHGVFCFWDFQMYKNQSRKTSVIRLPKFTFVNMAKNAINMQVLA